MVIEIETVIIEIIIPYTSLSKKMFRETLKMRELGAVLTSCTCTHMPLGCASWSLM
jgi:hypothetical protein